MHNFAVKEIAPVLWRGPTGTVPLRLIVIAPLRYRPPGGRLEYRSPAYLLTSDLTSPLDLLVQTYVHRWEIEVSFRDEKTGLGVGQAQVWSEESVERAPALLVAAYGALLLAAWEAYGPGRTSDYLPLPLWRAEEPRRASIADMRSQLRSEAWCSWLPTASPRRSHPGEAVVWRATPAHLALAARN